MPDNPSSYPVIEEFFRHLADFITNDLVLSESPSTGIPRQRKCFFHSEIFILRSYNFLHNVRTPLGTIAAIPNFCPSVGLLLTTPSPPYAPSNSTNVNDEKQANSLSANKVISLLQKTLTFLVPFTTAPFVLISFPKRVGARSRTRTQRVFVFCLHSHGDLRTTHWKQVDCA